MTDLRALREQIEPPQHIVDLAVEVSSWSPCRSKRGTVVFRGVDVVSNGYNYKPRGFDCDGSQECKATCRREAIHAEQQALLVAGVKADRSDLLHVKTVDGVLVPSGGPSCVQCSKLVLAAGIAGVWIYGDKGWQRYLAADFHQQSLQAESVALLARVERPHLPIKLEVSKEWCEKMAALEGDSDVTAGSEGEVACRDRQPSADQGDLARPTPLKLDRQKLTKLAADMLDLNRGMFSKHYHEESMRAALTIFAEEAYAIGRSAEGDLARPNPLWQLIETAPKDTALLLWTGWSYQLGHFNTVLNRWAAGWDHRPIEATHWLPLPDPPSADPGGGPRPTTCEKEESDGN